MGRRWSRGDALNWSRRDARNWSRREFLGSMGSMGAFAALASHPLELLQRAWLAESPRRLSYLAHKPTDFEGVWNVGAIEGALPADLNGTLYRIGPGSKNAQGTPLRHFFDGDAYLTALRFDSGRLVSAQSRFVDTPERKEERANKRMLYHEFGTPAPGWAKGYKNPPNVHVLPFADQLLTFSESDHPVAVDAQTLEANGKWTFAGTLPSNVTFTAHPKVDPATGDIYAYGISRSVWPALKVFRWSRATKTLTELYSIKLGGFYPIHDFMLTENKLVFVISPIYVSLLGAASLRTSISELMTYEASKPLRILVLDKNGGKPLELTSAPAGMVFHHCGAYEDADRLIFESIVIDDASVYDMFRTWSQERMVAGPSSRIVRFEIDLTQRRIISRETVSDGRPTDFPCVDPRVYGRRARYVHLLETSPQATDGLAFDTLVSWDRDSGKPHRVFADKGQVFGEPVFVPRPGAGPEDETAAWLLHLGYEASKDQTFLDVRRAVTLERETRVWLGRALPLGFHGSFVGA